MWFFPFLSPSRAAPFIAQLSDSVPQEVKNISFGSVSEAEEYIRNNFISGGFNLTGKDVNLSGVDEETANKIVDRLNEYVKKCNRLEDDLQYYKTKSASLETVYLDLQNENEKLKRIISKLEMERCEYLNDQQAKNKWGENYDI